MSRPKTWRQELGLTGNDRRRIENALCTLADFEGPIIRTLNAHTAGDSWDHVNVCQALRLIADDEVVT